MHDIVVPTDLHVVSTILCKFVFHRVVLVSDFYYSFVLEKIFYFANCPKLLGHERDNYR